MAEKTKGFLAEFKEFIARGNVLDMAVGVIIGSAFGKISTSLVNDILMPLISMLTGGIDFSSWQLVLKKAVIEDGAEVSAAVTVNFGTFLATILDFLIVAFAIFCLVKAVNSLHRKKDDKPAEPAPEPAPAPAPEPTKEEQLLAEIRDLLKAQDKGANG